MYITRSSYINSPSPIESELKKLFNEEDTITIFDIGSCEGEDSIRYSKLFPRASIYAVEPLAKNISILKENLSKFSVKNVTILPLAISDRRGEETFFVSSGRPEKASNNLDWDYGNKSSSLLEPDRHIEYFPWLRFSEKVEVSVDTLENICEKFDITSIDFIHMDVQGAELKVLQGAGAFLKRVKALWLEVEAVSLYKDQPLKRDVERFMRKHSFYKIKDTVNSVSGDQFYVNLNYCDSWLLKILSVFPQFKVTSRLAFALTDKLS